MVEKSYNQCNTSEGWAWEEEVKRLAIINIYEIQYVPYVHTKNGRKYEKCDCEKIRKEESSCL
jgi:hypothetical protein